MFAVLPPVRFTGAQILRDGTLQRRSLSIRERRFTRGPLPEVDLTGYILLPGIVDLHARHVERHLGPHWSAGRNRHPDTSQNASTRAIAGSEAGADPEQALRAAATEAAANGITTGWLAQGWSWQGGLRSPDAAERLMAAHARIRHRLSADLRIQLRAETHLVDSGARLLAAVAAHGIDYVVFNDHLDAAEALIACHPEEAAVRARRAGRSLAEERALVAALRARARQVPRHLCTLAEAFDELGVLYGSHRDPDGETRERYSMIGAAIAEFPTTRRAAAAARAMACPVLLGAPDVLSRGRRPGSVDAADLVRDGLCDALVSDDEPSALARAVWALMDAGLKDLPAAWAMISTRPAEILRLPDRGTLDPGRRADLVAVNARTRAIEMTVSAGAATHLSPALARRLAAQSGGALTVAAE